MVLVFLGFREDFDYKTLTGSRSRRHDLVTLVSFPVSNGVRQVLLSQRTRFMTLVQKWSFVRNQHKSKTRTRVR